MHYTRFLKFFAPQLWVRMQSRFSGTLTITFVEGEPSCPEVEAAIERLAAARKAAA
jgi:hypothetical protein